MLGNKCRLLDLKTFGLGLFTDPALCIITNKHCEYCIDTMLISHLWCIMKNLGWKLIATGTVMHYEKQITLLQFS
jgi:hypothetical protein